MNCDFSLEHYQRILTVALEKGYCFAQYDELIAANEYLCVLRHDVDYTPERCLDFAKIEKQLDIKAYYFFLVSSEVYNIRDCQNYKIIHELKNMGHYVGLHLDLSWNLDLKWEDVVKQCNEEKTIFETLTGIQPCNIISFHNPHKFTALVLNQSILGMEHTYEKRYFTETKYLSDSQGWYEGCMCQIFQGKKYQKIQLLTHPYIWRSEPNIDFIADMAQIVQDKSKYLRDYMIKNHPVCYKNKEKLIEMTEYKVII